jgi:KDO2-lipid IV(A) lauroyltransferase
MYKIVRLLLNLLSRQPIKRVQRIGAFIGWLAWYVLPVRRKTAIVNAGIIGAKDPVKTAKLSFRHTFMSYFETSYIEKIGAEFVEKYVTIEGAENFEALRHSGVYMFSAHLGSWDLVTPVVAWAFDARFLVVGRSTKSELLNQLLLDARNTDKVAYVFDKGFVEKIKEYTQAGYLPGSLLDHSATGADGVPVPFFGHVVLTVAAASAFAVRKRIPLLPAYLIRKENGFHLIVRAPIYPDEKLKIKERILDLTARINKEYEQVIREYPEQWYLLHRRFKRVEMANGKTSYSIYR